MKQSELEAVVKSSRFTGPKGAMGLTSDTVKDTNDYKLANAKTSKAFKDLQIFNLNLTKTQMKEMAALRRADRELKFSAAN